MISHFRPSTLAKPQHLVRSFSSAQPYFREQPYIHVASLARFLTSEPLPRKSFRWIPLYDFALSHGLQ